MSMMCNTSAHTRTANAFDRSEINKKPEHQKEFFMTTTLYQRLGGAEGMTRLVDDVVAAHLSNPLVKTRFESVKDRIIRV